MKRRQVLLALSSSIMLLAGCAAPRPHTRVEARLTLAPPAPPVEVIPSAPYPDAYWIPGHWKWNGHAYIWAHGHWEQARASMVYQRAYWSNDSGNWVYHPARWVSVAPPPFESAPVVVATPPPVPRVEVLPSAPSSNHVWISGFWRWSNGRHVWNPGHWEPARPGYFWAPGHWVKHGPNWTFSGGFWQHH